MTGPRAATVAALTLALAALVALPAGAAAHQRSVRMSGTAYEFNRASVRLAGATIRVAERPRLSAAVGADGRYVLAVPAHARITPYIVASGYHTIYLQTFRTQGENLENVNFQTPTEGIYRALALILKVPLDADGNPARCAIVSTFSTRNVRGVGFDAFVAYGAHGVAGARAYGVPALPKPVYFNEQVIPDPAQQLSSADGGVVWTDVPTGAYTVRASDPSTRFASFIATCRPGRVINANPPWGLHQLAPRNPARVSASWTRSFPGARLRALAVRGLPARSAVIVRCLGRSRCPFTPVTLRPTGSSADLLAAIGGRSVRLWPWQGLEVAVSSPAYNGSVTRWQPRMLRAPAVTRLCVPLGNTAPQRRCPTG